MWAQMAFFSFSNEITMSCFYFFFCRLAYHALSFPLFWMEQLYNTLLKAFMGAGFILTWTSCCSVPHNSCSSQRIGRANLSLPAIVCEELLAVYQTGFSAKTLISSRDAQCNPGNISLHICFKRGLRESQIYWIESYVFSQTEAEEN